MIEVFQLIQSIGKFDSVTAGRQTSLSKFTLIYGENGRGKTTLAAILKSLGINDASYIQDRHRLGASQPPHAVVKTRDGTHIFDNGSWSATFPHIAVFDDAFVAENVCSGIEIESTHRRKLHELILGAQGVVLNQELQTQVSKIEDHNRELKRRESLIPQHVRGGFSLEEFCALEPREKIEDEIKDAERRIAAAKEADKVAKRADFQPFQLPEFDVETLNNILSKTLSDLQSTAANEVQTHLESLGEHGESWVSEGMKFYQNSDSGQARETCPFCAQGLLGSPVIAHYQAFFSKNYSDLKAEITKAGKRIKREFGEDVPAAFERAVRKAIEAREFWSAFIEVPDFEIDTAEIVRRLNAARDGILKVLRSKLSAPLEPLSLSEEVIEAVNRYEEVRVKFNQALDDLKKCNSDIALIKEQSADANVRVLEADLAQLIAIKKRHSEPIKSHCQNYLQELEAKKNTEQSRNAARQALDNYQREVFPKYEESINTYLRKFNAGYRLTSVSSKSIKAGATCDYKVLINDVPVSLTSTQGPAFKNTLSAGDRNTLALAFFFASLEQEADLSQKVIVIDDPMTSLDEHRSLTTRHEIRHLANRVAQVIVFSHDKSFLCGLWEGGDRIDRSAILVGRSQNGSVLLPWDVRQDCITEHDKRHERVREYLQNSDPAQERNVAMALRYILESFVRVAYPFAFEPGATLGAFIRKCHQKVGSAEEILSEQDLSELRRITDYANGFHHDTNPAWETQQINDIQLCDFAERTLNFTQRPK